MSVQRESSSSVDRLGRSLMDLLAFLNDRPAAGRPLTAEGATVVPSHTPDITARTTLANRPPTKKRDTQNWPSETGSPNDAFSARSGTRRLSAIRGMPRNRVDFGRLAEARAVDETVARHARPWRREWGECNYRQNGLTFITAA
jgi:hypothetical protein